MTGDIYLTQSAANRRLVLNRPDRLNALTHAMWAAIPGLVREAEADQACRVIVIEGAGEKAFAAGQDIGEFDALMADRTEAEAFAAAVYDAQQALARCAKPVIAKIQGACIGGGCGLALCADLRIASERAKLGITPAKLGIAYGLADTRRIVDAVGPSRARDLLFTGRIVESAEALTIGLVDRVVEADALDAAVGALADTIAANAPSSVTHAKTCLTLIADGAADDTPETRRAFVDAFSGADLKEGVQAFKEKRPPDF